MQTSYTFTVSMKSSWYWGMCTVHVVLFNLGSHSVFKLIFCSVLRAFFHHGLYWEISDCHMKDKCEQLFFNNWLMNYHIGDSVLGWYQYIDLFEKHCMLVWNLPRFLLTQCRGVQRHALNPCIFFRFFSSSYWKKKIIFKNKSQPC